MTDMKTRLRAVALCLSLACAAGAAAASPVPDYPFVHVVGSAYTAVIPDIAVLDFEIVATDGGSGRGQGRAGSARGRDPGVDAAT